MKNSSFTSKWRRRKTSGAAWICQTPRRRPARKVGNITYVTEEVYRMNTLSFLEEIARNVRFSLRTLRRSPGFAAAAILTLAIGIGANTAVFSIVDGVLLKPLPYPEAG